MKKDWKNIAILVMLSALVVVIWAALKADTSYQSRITDLKKEVAARDSAIAVLEQSNQTLYIEKKALQGRIVEYIQTRDSLGDKINSHVREITELSPRERLQLREAILVFLHLEP